MRTLPMILIPCLVPVSEWIGFYTLRFLFVGFHFFVCPLFPCFFLLILIYSNTRKIWICYFFALHRYFMAMAFIFTLDTSFQIFSQHTIPFLTPRGKINTKYIPYCVFKTLSWFVGITTTIMLYLQKIDLYVQDFSLRCGCLLYWLLDTWYF